MVAPHPSADHPSPALDTLVDARYGPTAPEAARMGHSLQLPLFDARGDAWEAITSCAATQEAAGRATR
jgi:hypothetical protein